MLFANSEKKVADELERIAKRHPSTTPSDEGTFYWCDVQVRGAERLQRVLAADARFAVAQNKSKWNFSVGDNGHHCDGGEARARYREMVDLLKARDFDASLFYQLD